MLTLQEKAWDFCSCSKLFSNQRHSQLKGGTCWSSGKLWNRFSWSLSFMQPLLSWV